MVFFEAPHRIRVTLEELRRLAGDCQVAVARELTKAHEQLVRGPISRVLNGLDQERGEFTVVADIGHTPTNRHAVALELGELVREFGDLTADGGFTRRQAIAQLSRRHHVSAKEVYAALEQAKKSGE